MFKTILILAEARGGVLRNVSLELLAAAKRLSKDGQVVAAILGSKASAYSEQLAHYGADQVYIVEDDRLDSYTTDAYTQTFVQLIEKIAPDAILMGHTSDGKDLAPRLAARLGLGLASDCIDLNIEDGKAVFTRPIYAGKALQKKTIVEGIVFATIRPNNIEPLEPSKDARAEVVKFKADIKDVRTIIKEIAKKTAGKVDLSEAKIIVSGGRGVKNAEGFKPLSELAEVLGAAVGASRGACDAEYCDYSLQIGQTGKVVTPDLYIACGISGAIQHLAGMSNSKVIVAINKDPDAPIFQIANYGIVGDLFEVVPLLTKEFRQILGK